MSNGLQDERKTLNPRELMLAMQLYTPQFTLSNQQDAAEAFLLLLCCLREEFAESYVPKCGSWANVATPSDRVVMPERREELSEPERWRQRYLGPFDGILGSFLTCQSCSSEIIMDFDFFHTLALSPRVDGCASIAHGCTIEDCIRSFLAAEQVESYHCNHCWHLAAIKYLSFFEGQEEEIRKLHCCTAQDSCDCRNLSSLQTLPWSNCISRTFKQLSIAHCPKILCLQIQRVSINIFGELVKLQGHIRFPFVLDLSPFVKNQVGIRKAERDITKPVASQQIQPSISRLDYIGISEYAVSEPRGDPTAKAFLEVDSSQVGGCLDAEINHTLFNNEVMSGAPSPDSHKYHLVSVVEHWGRANGGHYTVYRGVRTEPDDEDGPGRMDSGPLEWFRVSDSEVYHASEEDVLAADASLLFYERTTN